MEGRRRAQPVPAPLRERPSRAQGGMAHGPIVGNPSTRLPPSGRVGRARSQARQGVTPLASYTEGHLPVAGIDLHYYRMGTHGRPPVVLLHGFSDGGLTWLRLARDLGPDYDLVMLDAA